MQPPQSFLPHHPVIVYKHLAMDLLIRPANKTLHTAAEEIDPLQHLSEDNVSSSCHRIENLEVLNHAEDCMSTASRVTNCVVWSHDTRHFATSAILPSRTINGQCYRFLS
jgi:hypothetical protein